MFVRYRNYAHDEGEVSLSTQSVVDQNDALGKKWLRRTFSLSGHLVANSTSEMIVKARRLEDAYAVDGGDLRLLQSNGRPTHIALLNAECLGGVRVTQRPSFPDMSNAAYVTYLPYAIVLEGLVAITSAMSYIAFEERLSSSGGGPRYGHLEPLIGRPLRQRLKRNTVYRVTQSGSAIGLYGYPAAPAPLWPAALVTANPDIEKSTPRRIGDSTSPSYVEYGISWSYQFESASPLIGNPNLWT